MYTGRFRALIPALVWALTIFVLSSFPGSAYPPTDIVNADKLVHIAIYGLLGGLCARGLLRGWAFSPWATLAVATLSASLYGVLDELHQWFVPGRNADWRDGVADAIGALAGTVLIGVLVGRWGRGRARAVR
ncbi:MAG TPA: VanZ family protein [Gemmatimonadales bacterium]|nr:VanZ family protein [Gemmatimonadales bacterium]